VGRGDICAGHTPVHQVYQGAAELLHLSLVSDLSHMVMGSACTWHLCLLLQQRGRVDPCYRHAACVTSDTQTASPGIPGRREMLWKGSRDASCAVGGSELAGRTVVDTPPPLRQCWRAGVERSG
jgi:hypothetical protein